ncbi:MAG: photosynthetic reaction center cytochrome PufC [Pseudomonadota bacterium]
MFPKWFNKWNKDEPADIYTPIIIFGGVGGAVLVAIFIIVAGPPWPTTETLQTGPRGTAMGVVAFDNARLTPDPGIAEFLSSESTPVPPVAGGPTAEEARENVPPGLEDLSVENYDRLLAAMREWTGIPDLFDDPDNYQTAVGHVMIAMTRNINESWEDHVNANKEVGVTCYTCHRGQPVPSDIWFKITPVNQAAEGWAAVQNRATSQSSYTSLPSDALEAYLLDYGVIGVHDLESLAEGTPGDEGYPTIQDAERTYSLMNYISNSLGVNCTFCHNTRAFYDGTQATPQWATELLGIAMVQELNNDWLVPLEGLLPEDRLGPVHQDAPKAACRTCHKGYAQPLQGTNVIANWPELASEEPEYN